MRDLQDQLNQLKREILELKTSQILPGYSKMFKGTFVEPAGSYDGIYAWTVTFDDSDDENAPILLLDSGWGLLKYNATTNTQKIEYFAKNVSSSFSQNHTFYSTRPIKSVSPMTKTGNRGEYTPPSVQTWEQVRTFKLSQMGTTPGWCLMNCRLGFGIQTGTYANAISDMQAQSNNGTLHGAKSTPPNYLQVPVYIDTGSPDGHVVVWDKGTVYSDGVLISNGLNYYGLSNVWGWGEYCDGARVVKKTS